MTSFLDWISSVPSMFQTQIPATPAAPPVPSIPKLADAIGAVCAASVNPNDWAEALSPFMVSSGITTPRRIAAFLGQVAEESARLSVVTENLNYGAAGLLSTFRTHFTADDAAAYARQPERIANRAYADRMGNGDEASGDGWRYRGAGLIQLTGKDNQLKFAAACGVSGDIGDYLRTMKGASQSACWFWTVKSLNSFADGWEITNITKRVNGGTNGLTGRINYSNAALRVLS